MNDGSITPPDLDAIRARAEEAFLVGSHGTASGVWFADVTEEDVREDARNTLALLAEIERLREALAHAQATIGLATTYIPAARFGEFVNRRAALAEEPRA